MRLIKRIVADVRGPNQTDNEVDMIINEALRNLQLNNKGERNDVDVISVKEVTKDSGIMVFIVLYEDRGLDVKG